MVNPKVRAVTDRIRRRSSNTRKHYLKKIEAAREQGPQRCSLSCTNLAHATAAAIDTDKQLLVGNQSVNIAIVSAYNDMLSAHQPLGEFTPRIKQTARRLGAVAQFAGGVPAMCDGVTQGMPGMELSLFSRDLVAMSTAIALSHNVFDAAMYLGVCDKIVPGLLMGALSFGHLPAVFVPAGPMTSGLPNSEKARIRQLFAEGKIERKELLVAETSSYHGPGTCTFYGTANSNQMLMEVMGLHVPGSAFVNPNTALRDGLTDAAVETAANITALGSDYRPVGKVVDEKAIVNAIVGLLATGGSTNHTIHLIAIARCAGIMLDWDDFSALSELVPQLTKIYPNGLADVNQFHAAGGMGLVIAQLLDTGFLHDDVLTVKGSGLASYRQEPYLSEGKAQWRDAPLQSLDKDIIADIESPYASQGGLKLLTGKLGRAVIKTSAVKAQHQVVEAPARIFNDQASVQIAFESGELNRDVVVVVRGQGPRANGMPELHKLTPVLGVLQDKGFHVALVTDGRMSGASGKIPAAIQLHPEFCQKGAVARLRDGDTIRLDATSGELDVLVDEVEFNSRALETTNMSANQTGTGRDLFDVFRTNVGNAETGAISCMDVSQTNSGV
ncbi:MAG: phosphogluconate dehydratase [Gammaproteobacteria bacterium]|nr:phosphogluconate dehydratase [Gammaproteobacteria bacterium]